MINSVQICLRIHNDLIANCPLVNAKNIRRSLVVAVKEKRDCLADNESGKVISILAIMCLFSYLIIEVGAGFPNAVRREECQDAVCKCQQKGFLDFPIIISTIYQYLVSRVRLTWVYHKKPELIYHHQPAIPHGLGPPIFWDGDFIISTVFLFPSPP